MNQSLKKIKSGARMFAVLLLFTCQFASASTDLDLFRFWVQDRFIRSVSWAKTSEEKLEALNALVAIAERSKNAPEEIRIVENIETMDEYRRRILHPMDSTRAEIENFLQRRVPKRLILKGQGGPVEDKIKEINSAYHRLMDREFSFPPKGVLTGFLSFFGVIKQRNVSFFDLLFEKSMDSDLAIKGLKAMSTSEKLKYLELLQTQVSGLFSTVKNSGASILEKSQITIKDPRAKRFLEIVLSEYFKSLSNETVWNIIFLQMESPEIESLMERFKLFSQNVGPQFHKLFQVIANDPQVRENQPELAGVFQSFQETLPPANEKAVAAIVANTKFNEFDILEFDPKPQKVGSMAQVHKVKVKFHHNGEEAYLALRVIKPGIAELLEQDNLFLDRLVEMIKNDPILKLATDGMNYEQIIKDLKNLVLEELDVKNTYKNQLYASTMLKTQETITLESGIKMNINIPDGFMSNNPDVMASRWVHGESLESFYEKDKVNGQLAAEAIFKNWMEKAILDNGFIHADLQAGNVKIEKSVRGDVIDAHILDYGMAGVINSDGRQLFALLSLGSALKNARLVARAVTEQSVTKPNIPVERLEEMLKVHFSMSAEGEEAKLLEKTVAMLMQNGFSFDQTFLKLVRGFTTARGLLQITESKKKPSAMILEIFRAHPTLALSSLKSIKHLKLEDSVGILKGLGSGAVEYAIKNPDIVINAGATVVSTGFSLFKRAKQAAAGKGGLFDQFIAVSQDVLTSASNSDTGKAVTGHVGGFLDGFRKTETPARVLGPSCSKFYE